MSKAEERVSALSTFAVVLRKYGLDVAPAATHLVKELTDNGNIPSSVIENFKWLLVSALDGQKKKMQDTLNSM